MVVVNRSPERAAAAAGLTGVGRVGSPADASRCDLVVNATPVGMGGLQARPGTGTVATADPPGHLGPPGLAPRPVPPAVGQLVVDLIYHPAETAWLRAAAERGARTANGLGMLVHQAAAQLAIWTGREAPVEAMWRAVP